MRQRAVFIVRCFFFAIFEDSLIISNPVGGNVNNCTLAFALDCVNAFFYLCIVPLIEAHLFAISSKWPIRSLTLAFRFEVNGS